MWGAIKKNYRGGSEMKKNLSINNPFTFTSPEELNAEQAQQLFVETFTDFPQVKMLGHSMIVGARGSGKSMMFRCLLPDVLMLMNNTDINSLEFLGFYFKVKKSHLSLTELAALDKHHASVMINEHFFVLEILLTILGSLKKLGSMIDFSEQNYKNFLDFYNRRLKLSGCNKKCEINNYRDATSFFGGLYAHAEEMHAEFKQYIINLDVNDPTTYKYNLPILSFIDFIVPVIEELKELNIIKNSNIFLFIDDADNLNKLQTKILNSWLASRISPTISIKVSTQIGSYKSYLTPNGTLVESPHDYQEINISERYTNNKSRYYDRVNQIVQRRLELCGIYNIAPEEFFQPYKKQEDAIEEEKKRLLSEWSVSGRGNRAVDDANRYARPNYIRDLGGTRKQRSSYMYAGFSTLVHLSSGIIRLFLDSAAEMFNEEYSKTENHKVDCISYTIQNKVVRDNADKFLFTHFTKTENDESALTNATGTLQKLQNLIFSIGRTFHDILVSNRAERRVFSIALSEFPTQEIKEVLALGVKLNYLHPSSIGTKDGAGRTQLYILNRYVSPHFTLDPTSFAGYLFVKNDELIRAMINGTKLKLIGSDDDVKQLSFLEEGFGD